MHRMIFLYRMIILLSGVFAASSNPPYAELDEALVDNTSIVPETPDSLLPAGSACPIGTLPMQQDERVMEGMITALSKEFRRFQQQITAIEEMGGQETITTLGSEFPRLLRQIREMKEVARQCAEHLETTSDSPAVKEATRAQLSLIVGWSERLEGLVQALRATRGD